MKLRSFAGLLAVIALVVMSRLQESALTSAVSYAAITYIVADLVWSIAAGCRRRWPYWTAESWREFLTVAAIPMVALTAAMLVMAAIELRLPIVGEPRSTARGFWVTGLVLLFLPGLIGLALVTGWLKEGDPQRQFSRPWRRRPSATDTI